MAATARLRDAFDANESDAEDNVLDHLRLRVIGNDFDHIAGLVTRMRYLLHHRIETGSPDGVPTPRLMEVDNGNPGLLIFRAVPSVIVGNPPFNPARTAAIFLKMSVELLANGGFLGMVMPASFLRGRRDENPDGHLLCLRTVNCLMSGKCPRELSGSHRGIRPVS